MTGPRLPGGPAERAWLAELYAQVPDVSCKGLCAESCGPFPLVPAEATAVAQAGGRWVTDDQILDALAGGKPATCPNLSEGRCGIYESRPLMCRLWGAIPAMRCPHGCDPTLDNATGAQLVRAVTDPQAGIL